MTKGRLLFVLVLAIPLLLALAQGLIVGRVSVVDGDTLEIRGQRIRLWGIDAVESSQTCRRADGSLWPCGRRAAFALDDFLGQRTVRCQPKGRDRYSRVVAVCWVGEVEVNRWLVLQGWALDYTPYSRGAYLDAQEEARRNRRGIWQGDFTPPWGYRRGAGSPPSAGSYGRGGRCDPSYPTVCIPPPPPDLDCTDIPYRRFKVLPPDPHRFDRDGDGIGCER
ncbi:thermonuclease family protein [Thermus caldifontis]|uniref:thermonuclease family protein n=1 Tax=Thermus caldifontis TaxID=1930763 RepID=UPI000DF115E8|nr:thermonuclease family protein [Thermus caldifontis]